MRKWIGFLFIVLSCVLTMGTTVNNLRVNGDKSNKAYIIIRKGASEDTFIIMDTLGLREWKGLFQGDSLTVLKRIYAVDDKGDTTFVWADTASAIWVKDATWISEFQANLWKTYAPSCPDSEFTETGSISFIGKADTATGNPIVIIETPINLQVQGSWVGDGILPNYWLGVKRGAADAFLKFYGNDSTGLSFWLGGSAEILDTSTINLPNAGLRVRINALNNKTVAIQGFVNKVVGSINDRVGIQGYSYDSSGTYDVIGVEGTAETKTGKAQKLYGGKFSTEEAGGNRNHYGVFGWGTANNESLCYGVYGKAEQNGSGGEIGVCGEGDIGVYSKGDIIGTTSIGTNTCDTIASAATIVLGDCNNFVITGTADIDSISIASTFPNWLIAHIQFTGAAAFFGVKDGKNLKIAGNFTYTADDILVIQRRGDIFYEVSRSLN